MRLYIFAVAALMCALFCGHAANAQSCYIGASQNCEVQVPSIPSTANGVLVTGPTGYPTISQTLPPVTLIAPSITGGLVLNGGSVVNGECVIGQGGNAVWGNCSGSGSGGITQLTGDATAGPGTGSQALTLATVNGSPGTTTCSTITTNGKGLVTANSAGSCSGGSSAFSALTSGTNTSAAMLVGTGASLGATGSGTITATALPASGLTGTVGVGNGGTGIASLTAGAVPMGAGTSPLTASEIADVGSAGVTIGSPTGGQKGAGTINVAGCYINGVACATSGGGGVTWPTSGDLVVSNGTSSPAGLAPVNNDLAYGSSGAWAALASADNAVLSTSGSGVPSLSTTLPSGLTAPSFTVTGALTATGLVTNADLVNPGLTLGSTALTLGVTTSTISGLTLTSPTINGGALSGTFSGSPTFSGVPLFSGLSTETQVSCLGLTSGNALALSSGACGSGGGSTTITLAPGLASTPGTYNTGTQTATNDSTITPQIFPVIVSSSGTQTVASTDTAKLWIAETAGVTYSVPNPGAIGSGGYQFHYDGSHAYSLTTAGGTATFSGTCGATGTTLSGLTGDTQIFSDGTNYQCLGSSGGGTIIPNVVSTGSTVTLPATNSITIIKASASLAVDYTCSPGLNMTVKDGLGNDATNHLTLTPSSGTIDGESTFVMESSNASVTPFESRQIVCDSSGNSWLE